MKKKVFKKKEKKEKVPQYKYFIALMISLFVIVLPWVSYLKIINITGDIAEVFPNQGGVYIDLFLYYKEICIIGFGIFVVLFFIGEMIFPDYKINNYPLREKSNRLIISCVFVYLITVILSSVFSEYKNLTVMGSPTEGEGIFVLVSYMVLFLASVNYFSNEKSIRILKKSIIIFMTIICILTMIEFLYKPIFEIPFFRQFLASDKYSSILSSIENKDYKGMVSLSMYNPNYFGALCILLFPISFTIFIKEKNKRMKIYLGLLSISMIFCTVVAKSAASNYVLVAELLILIITYRQILMKNTKIVGIYIIIFISIFGFINIISNNKLLEVAVSGLKNTSSIINTKEKFLLKDIIMDGDTLEIHGENNNLITKVNLDIKLDGNVKNEYFKFFNERGKEILPIVENNIIKFVDDEFNSIIIENLGYGIIVDIGYNDTMQFYVTQDGFKGVGQNGAMIDNIKRDNEFLTNLYPFATGRGYTWVNTLPILKETIILGTGPGTFAMNFKQNDYVGLMNTHGSTKFVIDKPHSMYLQIATQTGFVGLIALLIIFISAILKSINMYFKVSNKNNNSEKDFGLGIFIGILGFLTVSLVNDSIVTVNPIFWILLGVNFSIVHFLIGNIEFK